MTPARVVLRFATIAGLLGLTGLSLMRLLLGGPLAGPGSEPAGRATRRLTIIVGLAAVAATALYAAVVTAQFALVSAFRPDLYVSSLASSSFGRGLLLLLAVQIVTVATAARATRRSMLGAVRGLAAAACLVAFALTGHAAQRDPTALVVAADIVHLAAASLWLAGLVVLIVAALATPRDNRVTVTARLAPPVSRVALASVIALVATGIIATIVQLPTIATLWSTRYGQLILAKAALLGLVSVIGAINLARTRPRLETRTNQPRVRRNAATLLRRLATVEVALIGVIIALTTILTSITPAVPRAREHRPGRGPRRPEPSRRSDDPGGRPDVEGHGRPEPRGDRQPLRGQGGAGRETPAGRGRRPDAEHARHGDGEDRVRPR